MSAIALVEDYLNGRNDPLKAVKESLDLVRETETDLSSILIVKGRSPQRNFPKKDTRRAIPLVYGTVYPLE